MNFGGFGQIDSWNIEKDGMTYLISLDDDYDSSTADADCYSPSDVEAFTCGHWQYVGVTVWPIIDGLDAPEFRESLWGVEYGTMPAETEPYEGGEHEEITIDRASIELYPVPDLISEVTDRLRTFRDSLNVLDLEEK